MVEQVSIEEKLETAEIVSNDNWRFVEECVYKSTVGVNKNYSVAEVNGILLTDIDLVMTEKKQSLDMFLDF